MAYKEITRLLAN